MKPQSLAGLQTTGVYSRMAREAGSLPRDQSRHSFVRSVSVLAGGTALAQGLAVLASPILTRLYSPDDFGLLAVYMSILSVLVVMSGLRYEVAIPLPAEEKTAVQLLIVSLVNVLGTACVVGISIRLYGSALSQWVHAPGLGTYLWLLPFSLFGAGFYQALNYWAVRQKKFGLISRTKLAQSLGQVSTQLIVGALFKLPVGLFVGDAIGRISGSGTLASDAFPSVRTLRCSINAGTLARVAKEFWRYPVLSVWSAILNTISVQLPVVVLSVMFDSAVVGLFSLSLRVLQTPMTFVGQAVSQVYLSGAAEARRNGTLQEFTLSVFRQLTGIAAPPLLLLGVSGGALFRFVFGEQWTGAGQFSQWLTPWLFLVFLASPLSSLVFVLDRQREELMFQVTLLALRVAAIFAGAKLAGALGAVALYGTVSAVLWLLYVVWLMNISGNGMSLVLRVVGRELVNAFPAVVPALVAVITHVSNSLLVCAIAVSGCLVAWQILRHARSRWA